MKMKTDMKDRLFRVTSFNPLGGCSINHVKAFDLDHAIRIAARLFGNDVAVNEQKGRFQRFKEFNR